MAGKVVRAGKKIRKISSTDLLLVFSSAQLSEKSQDCSVDSVHFRQLRVREEVWREKIAKG